LADWSGGTANFYARGAFAIRKVAPIAIEVDQKLPIIFPVKTLSIYIALPSLEDEITFDTPKRENDHGRVPIGSSAVDIFDSGGVMPIR